MTSIRWYRFDVEEAMMKTREAESLAEARTSVVTSMRMHFRGHRFRIFCKLPEPDRRAD